METSIYCLASYLPHRLRAHATAARVATLAQFVKFAAVGLTGLAIDTAAVYGLRGMLGLYGAGCVAYLLAASGNWLLHRVWTFRGQGGGSARRQWGRFLMVNLIGFVLNRGVYGLLVTFATLAAKEPVIATTAGAAAGLFVNFTLSRRLVFR
ncbi:MAG: GtrA family protein [Rhodospirillales bacterium]